MSFLKELLGRQQKVTNQKLADDISNLCEELTSGIIELSNKANKINELKEKYSKSQSELEESSTNPGSAESKPKKSKGIFSGWFGSDDDDVPPPAATDDAAATAAAAAATNQLQSGVDSPTTGDTIEADSLSAASTAQLASPGNAIDQSAISQGITPQSTLKDSNSISDKFLSVGSDFSSSSDMTQKPLEQASPSLQPAAASSVAAVAASPAAAASPASLSLESSEPAARDASDIGIGGKNRKKSKRSKQTIRKANKNSNRVTKKQKNTTTTTIDNKANTQGLAQALLQAQGQA